MRTLFLFFILTFLASCKKEAPAIDNSFTVSGTIKGLDTDFMIRSYRDAAGNRVSDTIVVKDESFFYTAQIDEPTFIFFWPYVERTIKKTQRGGYYPVKSSQFAFLANPGDQIVFEGEVTDFIHAYPSGTQANDDLASINSEVFPLMNRSVNYLLEMELLEEDAPRRMVLEDSVEILDAQVIDLKKNFIFSHPQSEAAAWYLSDMMLRSQISDEEAVSAFKAFADELKAYRYYKEVATRVEGIEATQVGKIVQNFTTDATFTGETFEFDALKGKYVLMDFWGTWCGPCIAEMPKVKAYQEKYEDRLTVLGVNQGDSKDKIDQFITPKGYTWTHLMNGKGEDDFVLKFNVAGFPTKFIIDPEGKILNRFVGDGEESFSVLDSLLQPTPEGGF
jgi:thiol-disulfide isomerase/thioredoxin